MSLPKSVIEGKFEVLHKISEGGMGAVYKVRHILLDEPFVIKVIRPQHEGDEDLQKRFLHEAQAAIRLRHNNIAEIKDFSIGDDGTAYIVMEFIEGATLKQILTSQGPPDLGLTLEIADQSLKALGFLHRQGYIHRDVSPDNLMLTRTPDDEPLIKLIDLGLAKRLESEGDLTTTGMFLGKVRYSAPEQFKGEPLDQRSDLYSFGIMLYQLLTGQSPIEGAEFSQFIAAHLFKPPVDFESSDPEGRVPPGLRRVVLKTLEKDRDQRVQSAEELASLLAPFREPGPAASEDLSETIALRLDDRTPALQQRVDTKRILKAVTSGKLPRSREASVARVEEYLRKRELDEATAALVEAEREHGIDENTQELRSQLEELRRREREERMNALLEKARRQIAVNEMEEALTTLQKAQEIDDQNVSAQTLLVQVQTTVDRKRAAKPKRHLAWRGAAVAIVILALLGWFGLQPSTNAPDGEKPTTSETESELSTTPADYQIALDAYNRKDWQTTRNYLQKTIEADPEEREEGPYLPHFHLGQVYFHFANNCPQAIKAWAESESQGVVKNTRHYQELLDARTECQEEYRRTAGRVSTIFQRISERSLVLENPTLEVLWSSSTQLTQQTQQILKEREELGDLLRKAETRENFGAIIDLEDRVMTLEEALEDLLEELKP